jgi:LysR family transcriptional regulator, hydrogen peroxide-inducible genes activator
VNLRDLEYLVAVVDHGHFGRAAEACHVSQPTLSMQIKKLERELGLELLERGRRGASATPAGERVAAHARSALREARAIEEVARALQDPASGTLRLGLFPTLAPYLLPHVVPGIRGRFPRLELLLVEEKTEVLLALLRAGDLDAAVVALPVPDEDLEHALLFEEEFVLAVPAGHPLAGRAGPVPTSVLAGEDVLLLDEGHCLRDQALTVCSLAGAAERRDFRATSLETLRQMVAAGVGVTLLPALAVQPPVPASDDVVVVRLVDAPARRLGLLWRRTSPLRAFLPRLGEALRDLPAGLVEVIDPDGPGPGRRGATVP